MAVKNIWLIKIKSRISKLKWQEPDELPDLITSTCENIQQYKRGGDNSENKKV